MIRKAADVRVEVRDKMRGGAGSVTVHNFLEKDDFTAPVRLCSKLVLPPGAGIGAHTHIGEDEVYLVLSGSGLLDDGQHRIRVSTGDSVLTGNGETHAIHNDGVVPLEIIAMIMCYPQKPG